MKKFNAMLGIVLAAAVASPASAHGDDTHATPRVFDARKVEATAFGQAGDPRKVARTISIGMSDGMRFTPSDITVRRGDTVKFVVRNHGKVLHEMVLGTREAIQAHAEMMKKFPDMEHDDANMAHVKPGKAGEIVWQFSRAGEFQFACLLPGHFEAGMVGKVVVR